MTKQEMLARLKVEAASDDSVKNIVSAEKDNSKADEQIAKLDTELPTAAAIDAIVADADATIVPADADGISKNGGEMEMVDAPAERKKQDNAAKDVINVADRKAEESSEVQEELLAQLKEAAEREESYKAKIVEMKLLCQEAIVAQREKMVSENSKTTKEFFEAIVAKGEAMEKELTEAAEKNHKAFKTAKKLHEGSSKMCKILMEALKSAQPQKAFTRYTTPTRRALEAIQQ